MQTFHSTDARGLETTSVRRVPLTFEEHAEDEDLRPEFCAESMSWGMRFTVLMLTLLQMVLVPATMLAVIVSPLGVLAMGVFGAVWIAGVVALSWFLLMLFVAMLENNAALGAGERRVWFVLFLMLGPAAWLPYFGLHVWQAPRVPHREEWVRRRAGGGKGLLPR